MKLLLENYLPQQPPMRLLDSIISVDEEQANCQLTIREDNIFYDPSINGIYSWVGIELMAQTAAVFASAQEGEGKPRIGYLLSVRKFTSAEPYFKLGDTLSIIAHKEFLEQQMGVFRTEIKLKDRVVVTATLSAYSPTTEKK